MPFWEGINEYYVTLGEKYHVDPVLFLGIHIVATPLFLGAAWWLVRNTKRKKPIFFPALFTILFFNAANIYLVMYGKNIPFWLYGLLAVFTLYSGYISYKKIKLRIKKSS